MLLFFLLLKIFFAEQLPFTSLHWKLIFGYFLLLSVAVLVYPVFRKMRDQDRWSIQNGAIEIEEGVLHLSVVRGRETRRLNVEIKNLKIVTSDDVRIRIDTPVGQLTISADGAATEKEAGPSKIRKVNVRFQPGRTLKEAIAKAAFRQASDMVSGKTPPGTTETES